MSHAASARYGVPCTKCGARVADPCRTVSGKITDTHRARIHLAYDIAERRRLLLQGKQ